MRQVVFFLLIFTITTSWAQHTIEGVVLGTEDSLGLPGVNVILDSLNQTITDEDGKFLIFVEELPASLTFSYVGYLERTVAIQSWTNIKVFLKPYVLKHYFGSQKIGIYLQSGLINNPIGGKVYLTTPYFLNSRFLKGSIKYQTNLKENRLINGSASLDNILFSRYLGASLNLEYLEVTLGESYTLIRKSFDIDLWSRYCPIDLSVGYSNLKITDDEAIERYNGLVLTAGRYFNKIFKLDATTKFWIYKDLFGFQFQLARYFNRLHFIANYEQLDLYKEVNIGVGYLITYKFSDPNKY